MIEQNGSPQIPGKILEKIVQIPGDRVTEIRDVDISGMETIYQLLSPEGIQFLHYKSVSRGSTVLENNKTLFIQLHFSIQNNFQLNSLASNFEAVLNAYEYNLIIFGNNEVRMNWNQDDTREGFSLSLLPEHFLRYLPSAHPFKHRFEAASAGNTPVLLSDDNLPVTPKIFTILHDILNCPLEQHYKLLYLKAKLMELLLLVFSHYEEHSENKYQSVLGLQDTDIERMQQVRKILHRNIQNPCSLIDLAHQVGTNDNYLKKHFKQVFGQTVYGYVHEVRMQEAKRLILNEGTSIQEAARLTGYKHPQHFIAAFKRFFGYAPPKK